MIGLRLAFELWPRLWLGLGFTSWLVGIWLGKDLGLQLGLGLGHRNQEYCYN
jgi:hypothetical protein